MTDPSVVVDPAEPAVNRPARIAIVGGGLMGCGIAHTFVVAGHEVSVYDPDTATRASLRSRLMQSLAVVGADERLGDAVTLPGTLADAVAGVGFIFEAAPEKLELKRAIFAALEDCAAPDAILASNSSVIPITQISAGLATAYRMIGTHWWNPAHLIPLVEVVQGEATSSNTVGVMMKMLRAAGKVPAHIRKDVPGFVANRLQHALWREAIEMVAQGICDAATVDTCVKNSFGLRLPVLGPLENADLVGLDLTLDIHRTIIPELDRHAEPNDFLIEKVERGALGFKTGEGFQHWSPQAQEAVRQRLVNHLIAMKHTLEHSFNQGSCDAD